MIGLGIIEILILLLVLGIFGGLRRGGGMPGGVAAVLSGLALVVLIALGSGMLWYLFRAGPAMQQATEMIVEPGMQMASHSAQQSMQYNPKFTESVATHTTTGFGIVPIWIILFGGFAVVMLLRGLFTRPACGHRRIWPALVALPLIGFLFLGTARYQSHSTHTTNNPATVKFPIHRASIQSNAKLEAQRAQITAKTKQIEQMDISELMDQFDAPQIPLSALPAAESRQTAEVHESRQGYIDAMNSKRPAPEVEKARKRFVDALTAVPHHTADVNKVRQLYVDAMNSKRPAREIENAKRRFVAALTLDRLSKQKQLGKTPSDILAEMDQSGAPQIPLLTPQIPAPTPPIVHLRASSNDVESAKRSDGLARARKSTNSSQKTVAESKTESPKVTEKDLISIEPLSQVPGDSQPAWVNQPPKRTGNTRREVIATDEYESIDECYLAGDVQLMLKTWHHMLQLGGRHEIDQSLPSVSFKDSRVMADGTILASNGVWHDSRLSWLNQRGINPDYLRRELVSKDPTSNEPREFLETVERSFGPMKKLYLQIEFTPNFDREVLRLLRTFQRGERFEMFGVTAVSLLGLLGIVFGILKVDTATKGYYTKRLFIGVPLAILGLFGLYAMLVEMGFDLPH